MIRAALVVLLALVWADVASAECVVSGSVSYTCDDQGEAYVKASLIASTNYTNRPYGCGLQHNASNFNSLELKSDGSLNVFGNCPDSTGRRVVNWITACADKADWTGWVDYGPMVDGTWPEYPASIPVSCDNGCTVIADGPSQCAYSDEDSNQTESDGDIYMCLFNFSYFEGSVCTEGTGTGETVGTPPVSGSPAGPQYDCTTVQCGPGGEGEPGDGGGGGGGDGDGGGDGGGVTPGTGGPGSDGTPDPDEPVPDDGTPCQPGDANCVNDQGDECTVSDASCQIESPHESDDGDESTCDPATDPNQCAGPQSASTSTNCEVAPTCSGDIIQCAILKQQWKNMCELTDLGGEKAPWDPAAGDADYGRDLAEEAEEIDLSTGLDTAGFGGGACPAAPALQMFGQTVSIDMGPICDVAGIIRFFVIITATIWAGAIVVRAF